MTEEYKLKLEDAGKTLEVDGENPNDQTEVVIPSNSDTPFPIGTEIKISRTNEKVVEIYGSENVSIETKSQIFKMKDEIPTFWIPKYGEASLRKRALNSWALKVPEEGFLWAEGGDDVFIEIIENFLYRIHVFRRVGENKLEFTNDNTKNNFVEYLVIAGGGSGGGTGPSNYCGGAGGGGAGGYRCSVIGETSGGGLEAEDVLFVTKGKYDVFVGAGGVASDSVPASRGTNGQNSVFGPIVSVGGGAGGAGDSGPNDGASGGSGGGAFRNNTGGNGIEGQGFNGGSVGTSSEGCGGGGAGGPGIAGTSSGGGAGGAGLSSFITGVLTARAGGGAGGGASPDSGCNNTPSGSTEAGGGVGGATVNNDFLAGGLENTGSGGGGSRGADRDNSDNDRGMGNNGGSGIVIVRYKIDPFKVTIG